MFIATLFMVVKIWKQQKCPVIDDWIKKMWCFALFLTSQGLGRRMCKAVPLAWQLQLHFNVALFILLFPREYKVF